MQNPTVENLVEAAAEEWCRNALHQRGPLYLYFRRPGPSEPLGELRVFPDGAAVPDGFELAMNERLSPGWTRERFRHVVGGTARRLPLLNPDMA